MAGLDAHLADWFVPVPGVTYLGNVLRAERLRERSEALWSNVSGASASLVLVNGLWGKVPELQDKIVDLARRAHVVLGELARPTASVGPRSVPPPLTSSPPGRIQSKVGGFTWTYSRPDSLLAVRKCPGATGRSTVSLFDFVNPGGLHMPRHPEAGKVRRNSWPIGSSSATSPPAPENHINAGLLLYDHVFRSTPWAA